MKKVARYLSRLFSPKHLQDIDVLDLLAAMSNETVRKAWIYEVYQDLRQMNLDVETALLNEDFRLTDLAARRKAYQEILEKILVARNRQVKEKHPDPRPMVEVDLDRVTV